MSERTKRKSKSKKVPSVLVRDEDKTRFSFESVDLAHSTFDPVKCDKEFWMALMKALKEFETMDFDTFIEDTHKEKRHHIDFGETIEPNGFPGKDVEQFPALQFPVGDVGGKWRVYGYYSLKLFYIVWLDTEHALYAKGKH